MTAPLRGGSPFSTITLGLSNPDPFWPGEVTFDVFQPGLAFQNSPALENLTMDVSRRLHFFPTIGPMAALLAALLAWGCGDQPDDSQGAERGTDNIEIGDPNGLDEEQDVTPGRRADGSCSGLTAGDGCLGEVFEGEAVPLDLYLMFDQSGSMSTIVDEDTGTLRIDIVRSAVRTFLQDEDSIGMGAGIGYFGDQPLKKTTCDPQDFREPDVEIGTLPAREESLLQSIESKMPTGETPTGAAIRGACEYVAAYKRDNSGRHPSILLVTDGEPKAPLSQERCAPTLDDAVEAARECFEDEGIFVYVLGVGPSLTNLRVIAEAGGTNDAYLADLDNSQQVLDALFAVRNRAQLPCNLSLSREALDGQDVDLAAANVGYLDADCGHVAVSAVTDADACDDGQGWYFDDPEAPSRIHLCASTCGDVKAKGQQLYYSLGCPLQVDVVR